MVTRHKGTIDSRKERSEALIRLSSAFRDRRWKKRAILAGPRSNDTSGALLICSGKLGCWMEEDKRRFVRVPRLRENENAGKGTLYMSWNSFCTPTF